MRQSKDYEDDIGRLIKLFTIRPDALSLMTELAIQAGKLSQPPTEVVNAEEEKEAAIALCKRRIEARRL